MNERELNAMARQVGRAKGLANEPRLTLDEAEEAFFKQPKIIGYRQLTKFEAQLVNTIKGAGLDFDELSNRVREHINLQRKLVEADRAVGERGAATQEEATRLGLEIEPGRAFVIQPFGCVNRIGLTRAEVNQIAERCDAETRRLDEAHPEHWVRLARTHFQEGLMALVRAVTQPGGF